MDQAPMMQAEFILYVQDQQRSRDLHHPMVRWTKPP